MVAALALMESPAIILGIVRVRLFEEKKRLKKENLFRDQKCYESPVSS